VHPPVPEQSPDQPEKTEPLAAAAESVTIVPVAYACEHVAPQLMPAGFELTVPEPLPEVAAVNVWVGVATLSWIDVLPVRPPFAAESLSVTVSVTVFVPAEA
jgi:hypothetical protein